MKDTELQQLALSLKENDKEIFNQIKKTDLHTHALLSCNRNTLKKYYPDKTIQEFKINNSIYSLSQFIKDNLLDITTTKEGQLTLFECTIITAIEDGITILDTSIDYRLVYEAYQNDIKKFINDLKQLKNKYKHKITINYDLGISRNAYKPKHKHIIHTLIKSKIFHGIDLFGDELSQPITLFKNIYKNAKRHNLILKAHIGEFGTAYDIYKAIKTLHLDVVQHGISIVNNRNIMKYAKNKRIIFNICPTSNLKLQRIKNIKEHPIKEMYNYGLIVTINTDDQLIFENSLFDEYKLLYKNNLFTIEELNNIRLYALKNN